jgi:glycerol-3-phosphate dehydrogenase (NAD(P)+)
VDEAQKHGLYMPLAKGLSKLLFDNAKLESLIGSMMTGEQKWDVEFATNEENSNV